jgi:MFS family permease
MFGVFLFLTYFLQTSLGFSPLETGLAFLAMTFSIVVTATSATTKLLPRFGARPLVTSGLALASLAMLFFTGISVESTYAADVLPGLVMMGIGFGLVMAPSMAAATFGVAPADAGVASAMVNTGQQIGGSIGTALLSTLAAGAATDFAAGARPSAELLQQAAIHGYTTAFTWSAAIFAIGGLISWALLSSGAPELDPDAPAELAFAH